MCRSGGRGVADSMSRERAGPSAARDRRPAPRVASPWADAHLAEFANEPVRIGDLFDQPALQAIGVASQ